MSANFEETTTIIEVGDLGQARSRIKLAKFPPAFMALIFSVLLVLNFVTNSHNSLEITLSLFALAVIMFAGVSRNSEWAFWLSLITLLGAIFVGFRGISLYQLLILAPLVWIAFQGVRGCRSLKKTNLILQQTGWVASGKLPKVSRPGILMQQNRGIVVVFLIIAILCWLIAASVLMRGVVGGRGTVWDYPIDFAAFLISALGFWLVGRARRHAMLGVGQLLKRDERKPIFLLRSFQDDLIRIHRTIPIIFPGSPSDIGFEESLTHQLWNFGPVIALGQPGETLPPVGAAREYVDHEKWQKHVDEWLEQAQVVVLIMGKGEGVLWELARLMNSEHSDRTLLVFPPISTDELNSRWRTACERIASPKLIIETSIQDAVAMVFPPNDKPVLFVDRRKRKKDSSYKAAVQLAIFKILGALQS